MPELDPRRQYVIGTAGHIDHGKTALVKALTGVDTDRLPEEKARGITIDLGFAHLSENVTIIDVPGHERLIKNMVAGVSTIDLVLLVVAADDGVMPQTREHLDIVRLLQIPHAVVAISKVDLVEAEWLALVEEEIRALLAETPFPSAPIIPTSATTGQGIPTLRRILLEELAKIPPRQDPEVFRLPVDRAFTAHGFGTVVTGTVLGGNLKVGDQVEIQPSGLLSRVRGLQSHGQQVSSVKVGYRAAVNLADIHVEQIQRGDVLVEPGKFTPAQMINARLWLLPSATRPLKNNQRVRLHIHTRETFGRIILLEQKELSPGESALVQIRLEAPVHAAFRDRFIIRQYSPQITLGGGQVLQVNPPRFRKRTLPLLLPQLQRLESNQPAEMILGAFDPISARPLRFWDVKVATNLSADQLQKQLHQLQSAGRLFRVQVGGETRYLSQEQLEQVLLQIRRVLERYHTQYPGRPGMEEKELLGALEGHFERAALQQAIQWGQTKGHLTRDARFLRSPQFQPAISARQAALVKDLEDLFRASPRTPPAVHDLSARLGVEPRELKEPLSQLRRQGKLVFVSESLFYLPEALEEIRQQLEGYFRTHKQISVPQFKEMIGSTRKHAIPLLEFFDRQGITLRQGDVRVAGPRLSQKISPA